MAKIQLIPNKSTKVTDQAHALSHYADIEAYESWQALINCYRQLQKQVSPAEVLFILDDANQCAYTNMHAKNDDALYFEAACDGVSESEWDDCYTNAAIDELVHIEKTLLKAATAKKQQKYLHDMAEKTEGYDESDWEIFCRVNNNPMPVLLDEAILVKVAHVSGSAQKFAMMPNGYFSCDFNPFENHALISILCQEYGFEFMGLGAALLGFLKTPAFKTETIEGLLALLQSVYHFPAKTLATLETHLLAHDYLLLFYTESPSDYQDFYA